MPSNTEQQRLEVAWERQKPLILGWYWYRKDCVWYDGDVEDTAEFYANHPLGLVRLARSLFEDSHA